MTTKREMFVERVSSALQELYGDNETNAGVYAEYLLACFENLLEVTKQFIVIKELGDPETSLTPQEDSFIDFLLKGGRLQKRLCATCKSPIYYYAKGKLLFHRSCQCTNGEIRTATKKEILDKAPWLQKMV